MAVKAPTVDKLSTLISQYTKAFAPQSAALDAQGASSDAAGAAQVAGINTAQNQAYGGITQRAQANGMGFTGFSPTQISSFGGAGTASALAKLQATISAARDTILGAKAGLATSANTDALGSRQNEVSANNDWEATVAKNSATMSAEKAKEKYDASETAKQDTFTASENAKQRAYQRAQAAAAAARAAAKAADKPPTLAELKAAINDKLRSVTGSEGGKHAGNHYVHPIDYAKAMRAWVDSGQSANSFKTYFGHYKDPKNAYYWSAVQKRL